MTNEEAWEKAIRELKDDLEILHSNFPTLKDAVIEWMEYQKAEDEDKG